MLLDQVMDYDWVLGNVWIGDLAATLPFLWGGGNKYVSVNYYSN